MKSGRRFACGILHCSEQHESSRNGTPNVCPHVEEIHRVRLVAKHTLQIFLSCHLQSNERLMGICRSLTELKIEPISRRERL